MKMEYERTFGRQNLIRQKLLRSQLNDTLYLIMGFIHPLKDPINPKQAPDNSPESGRHC